MDSSTRSYILPDLSSLCPRKASLNAYHSETATASLRWLLEYVRCTPGISEKFPMETLEKTQGALLAAYAYPYADAPRLRICADLINLLFFIDEVTDRENGRMAKQTTSIFLKSMRDKYFEDGSSSCQISKDFGGRFFSSAHETTARRFLQHFELYLNAVEKEAELREKGVVLDIIEFETLRRECSAVPVAFDLVGYSLDIDLPDEIFHHPTLTEIQLAAVDMVTWSNDLYSYKMEQASGLLACNVLTVLQQKQNITLQESSDFVGGHFKKLVARFEVATSQLPSFGKELDGTVSKYVTGLTEWVVGSLEWSFASQRYFGEEHKDVKNTLTVNLYPEGTA